MKPVSLASQAKALEIVLSNAGVVARNRGMRPEQADIFRQQLAAIADTIRKAQEAEKRGGA